MALAAAAFCASLAALDSDALAACPGLGLGIGVGIGVGIGLGVRDYVTT